MKFNTITEKEILYAAYYNLLGRWTKHIEHNEKFRKETGRSCEIDKHWIDIYEKQLEEIHTEILRLEQAAS